MRTEELLELRRREAAELAEADRIGRQLGIEQDPDPPALEVQPRLSHQRLGARKIDPEERRLRAALGGAGYAKALKKVERLSERKGMKPRTQQLLTMRARALDDFLVSQGRELERLRAKVRLPGDPERDPALAPLEARFGLLRTPEEDVSEDSGSELPDEGSGSGGAG
jgi:hypothetical protein